MVLNQWANPLGSNQVLVTRLLQALGQGKDVGTSLKSVLRADDGESKAKKKTKALKLPLKPAVMYNTLVYGLQQMKMS